MFRSKRIQIFLVGLVKVLDTVVMGIKGNKDLRRREKHYIPFGLYPVPRGTKILFEDKDFHVQIYYSIHICRTQGGKM